MIAIRRARLADAPGIAAVHVATWRSAYADILPEAVLTKLSEPRLTHYYEHGICLGLAVHVAATYGRNGEPPVLGFCSASRSRESRLGDGEIETLYMLDDYQNRGLGGQLLRNAARHLWQIGCRSVYAWVLRENPSRYFYQRLGGKCIAEGTTIVGGETFAQSAYAWDPIETLLDVNA
ncbi:GNAT family N-acetyltransferase [Acidocella sp.]|uniref:GNAT family N-acetyltransferase n=1 Tax=Acidocella sp. TaxID=50710 RepID=UPI00260646BA|nr:GNAT family N-acetyltransferase [Acidocella sp.]